jgi:hypothetical protein
MNSNMTPAQYAVRQVQIRRRQRAARNRADNGYRAPRWLVPQHAGERFVYLNGRPWFVSRGRWTGTVLMFAYADMRQYHRGHSSAFYTWNGAPRTHHNHAIMREGRWK